MIPIFISIDAPEFDKDRFLKTLREKIRTQVRQAARAFLRAAMVRVPVDSGMSKGSFIPLATLLKVALPINPRRTNQRYFTKDLKTPELGASFAVSPDDIFQEANDVYSFYYDNQVLQYNLNELTNGGSKSAPWLSYEEGERAFYEYFENNFESKLPQIADYINYTTIKSGPDGLSLSKKPLTTTSSNSGEE